MWQFTIWCCWSAMLASKCNNIILKTKKGCSLQAFLLRKSLHLYGHVHGCRWRTWRRKQLDNKRARRLWCWVTSLSDTVQIKSFSDNSYQIITMILSELNILIHQVQGLSDIQRTLITVEFWDHCCSCKRQQNRCTQGVLLFTWPTALAWETVHVLWLQGLDCGSVAFNVLYKQHNMVYNNISFTSIYI